MTDPMYAGMVSALIAHAGGWDEILILLAPIAVYVLLIRPLIRRRNAQEEPNHPEETKRPDGP